MDYINLITVSNTCRLRSSNFSFSCYGSPSVQGARLAMNHLFAQGYHRIANPATPDACPHYTIYQHWVSY